MTTLFYIILIAHVLVALMLGDLQGLLSQLLHVKWQQ